MNFFFNQPLRHKLMLVVMMACAVGLLLAAAAFMGQSIHNLRTESRADIQAQAQILAANLSGSIEFEDHAHALKVISALRSKPQYVAVAVINLEGLPIASDPAGFSLPSGLAPFAPRPDGEHISVCVPVVFQDHTNGLVYLRSDLSNLRERILNYVWLTAVVLVVSFFAAFWLASILQGIVSRPIIRLAHTARNVTAKKDYSLRALSGGNDEIGGLIQDFNSMLAQIQAQDTDLQQARNELESRVAQRTRQLEQEIAERLRVETAMASQKEYLDVTLRSIGEGVIAVDLEAKVVHINAVAEYLTGRTQAQAIGRPLFDVLRLYIDKERASQAQRVDDMLMLLSNQPHRDYLLISCHGDERYIAPFTGDIRDNSGQVIGNVIGFRDVTDKRRTDQELLKASKLESISVLAGGIAHDFNNLLTAIMGNISLAKLAKTDSNALARSLQDAETASIRASELTRQLLTFSKGGAPVKKNASLAELIQETANFVLHGANVGATVQIAPGLWPAEVDSGQISQVIQNLIINAIQAMPEGGKLTVRASNFFNSGANGLPLSIGEYVLLSVQDRGTGIAPEHLSKIFDPYFSTKTSGHGLGLAMCYSVVHSHQGHIAVRSLLGYGSTFDVYLPACANLQLDSAGPQDDLIQGSGPVLIMDDEESIRVLAAKMLTRMGYEALTAINGQEALAIHKQYMDAGTPLRAIILDLTIPGGMSGREAIERLRQVDMCVKTVVSSGYYDDSTLSQFRECGFDAVLPKPYSVQDLGNVLQSLLKPSTGKAS